MGYNTRYSLKVIQGDEGLIPKLRDENDWAASAFNSKGMSLDEHSWYSHQSDMQAFSKLHPEAVFELSGAGEEIGDLWKEYYSNGKIQVASARIVYNNFDPNKLV